MSSEIIPQVPEVYGTGIMPFQGPSSRTVARATRWRTDTVLGRAEMAHGARDQARAVLAAGALNNTAALVGPAEQAHGREDGRLAGGVRTEDRIAPAGDPYYQAIIRAYAQDIAEF